MTDRNLIMVGIAEMKIASAPDRLIAYGLGSCIGIIIYDQQAGIAGLAHILLPAPLVPTEPSVKFASTAVELMLAELAARPGCVAGRLRAKIAGGAHMFDTPVLAPEGGIGERNAAAARAALARHGIPLVAEDTGGSCGRTVEFDPATGELAIRSLKGRSCRI